MYYKFCVSSISYSNHPKRTEPHGSIIWEGCKTPKNSNFLKNDRMIISVKIRNFFRSRMMKRTSLLDSPETDRGLHVLLVC